MLLYPVRLYWAKPWSRTALSIVNCESDALNSLSTQGFVSIFWGLIFADPTVSVDMCSIPLAPITSPHSSPITSLSMNTWPLKDHLAHCAL